MAFISGDRRRRVLTEQIASAAGAEASATATPAAHDPVPPNPAYEADAITRLPRLTDLVPQRKGMLALAWFLLVGTTAGLVALAVHAPGWAKWLSAESLAAFDLSVSTGLAAWFKTVMLLSAAALCAIIYSVRRHRTDDYQGRYRAWATAGVCWLLLSLASSVGLSNVLPEVGIRFTAWQGWQSGALWWLAPLALVYGITLLRMGLDMSRAPFSLSILLVASLAWSAGLAMEFKLLASEFAPPGLAPAALLLAGPVLLVISLLTYARLVALQAAGKIVAVAVPRKKKEEQPAKKKRRAKSAADSKSAAKSTSKTARKTGSEDETEAEETTTTRGPWGRKPSQPASTSSSSSRTGASALTLGRNSSGEDDDDSDSQFGGSQKLSKADRKRLRRERTRESRAA